MIKITGLRFTILDWITYLFPSGIIIWAVRGLFHVAGKSFPTLVISDLPLFGQVILFLVICYSIGHVLQSIANFTIDLLPFGGYPPRNYFPKKFDKHFSKEFQRVLLSSILKHFGIQEKERIKPFLAKKIIKNAYWHCYTFLLQKQQNSLAQVFLGLAGFLRSMSVCSFLIAIGYFITGLVVKNWVPIWVAIAALLIGFLFLARVIAFKEYLTMTVYSEFLSAIQEGVEKA